MDLQASEIELNEQLQRNGKGNTNDSQSDSLDSETVYSQLIEFRSKMKDELKRGHNRKQMLALYKGERNQQWFIDELIENFEILLEYQSGIAFFDQIRSSMKYVYPKLLTAVYENISYFLNFSTGVETIIRFIREFKDHTITVRFVEEFISGIQNPDSKNGLIPIFFQQVLKIYKHSEKLKNIILSFDWSEGILLPYLPSAAKFCTVEKIEFFNKYIDNPMNFINNQKNIQILDMILFFGERNTVDILIDQLVPNMQVLLAVDDGTGIQFVLKLIDRANNAQLQAFYLIFDQILINEPQKAQHDYKQIVVSILTSMRLQARLEFMKKHYLFFSTFESMEYMNLIKSMVIFEPFHSK